MGFAFKTGDTLGVRCKLWREDLDGDVPVEPSVAGTIDLAHGAGSKRSDDFVQDRGVCRWGATESTIRSILAPIRISPRITNE